MNKRCQVHAGVLMSPLPRLPGAEYQILKGKQPHFLSAFLHSHVHTHFPNKPASSSVFEKKTHIDLVSSPDCRTLASQPWVVNPAVVH